MPRVSHWQSLVSLAATACLVTPLSAEAGPVTLSKLQYLVLLNRIGIGSDPGFTVTLPSPIPLPEFTPLPLTNFILPGSNPGTAVDPTSTYSASTTQFGEDQTRAEVKASVELDAALSRTGVPLQGQLALIIIASNSYQLVVNEKPGETVPSDVTEVPTIERPAGSVRCSPSGLLPADEVGIVEASAEVDVSIPTFPLLDEEKATCFYPTKKEDAFNGPTGVKVPIGKPVNVSVFATGIMQLQVGPGGLFQVGGFEAVADPSFEIDPSFPYADAFEIDYSPGFEAQVPSTDIPEPSSLLLLAVGAPLAVVLGQRVRRARQLMNGHSQLVAMCTATSSSSM